jgi:hypothetical protein
MMRKFLVSALAAVALAAAAVPASAQFYAGAGPYGAGVQIGPFAAGVGPGYGWHHDYWGGPYADAGACRVIRERTVLPTGEVVFSTHRACY